MGPVERLIGPEVPEGTLWQDPVPTGQSLNSTQVDRLKAEINNAGIDSGALIRVAWASASTFRKTDFRGGANGARIRLFPQNDWETNAEAAEVVGKLEAIGKGRASVADMIVLAGC